MNRNKLFFLSLALIPLIASLLPSPASARSDPSRYRHKNRLLLVFASSRSDQQWQMQNGLLAHSQAAFQDRDLLRFDYIGGDDKAVRQRYGVKLGQFQVLLIGKDGHVASSSTTPVALSDLTGQIDKMPMRRDEMRQRGR